MCHHLNRIGALIGIEVLIYKTKKRSRGAYWNEGEGRRKRRKLFVSCIHSDGSRPVHFQ